MYKITLGWSLKCSNCKEKCNKAVWLHETMSKYVGITQLNKPHCGSVHLPIIKSLKCACMWWWKLVLLGLLYMHLSFMDWFVWIRHIQQSPQNICTILFWRCGGKSTCFYCKILNSYLNLWKVCRQLSHCPNIMTSCL